MEKKTTKKYDNQYLLNAILHGGTEHILKTIAPQNIKDPALKKMFDQYWKLKKDIVEYILENKEKNGI